MSMTLMGMVWDIEFPTQTQKFALLKMADHASDNGKGIWPSNESLARNVSCDKRSIRRALASLREAGVIHLVTAGGEGEKATNEWEIDTDLPKELFEQRKLAQGTATKIEIVEGPGKGGEDILSAPRTNTDRGRTPVSGGADTPTPQTTINHQIEPNARGALREKSRAPRAEKAKPIIIIESGESAFGRWLDRMAECNRDDMVTAARDTGFIKAHSRWPPEDGLQGLVSAGSIDIANRKQGGDA